MSSEPVPFEGVEKRLVIQFSPEIFTTRGLKNPFDMTTSEWQPILDYAQCQIMSEKILGEQKVYLLSESTLLVWSTGFLMKTCGRTTPFLALHKILESFGSILGNKQSPMEWVNWMTYSRLDFLHPDFQIWPHQNFDQELRFIRQYFPEVQSAEVPAGDNTLYVLFAANDNAPAAKPYIMEECLMIGINEDCVQAFTGYQNASDRAQSADASDARPSVVRSCVNQTATGPKVLDEYWFDPCGYSCNALFKTDLDSDYFSCHVSPEAATSYASLELASTAAVSLFRRDGALQMASMMGAFQPQNINLTRILLRAVTKDDSTPEAKAGDATVDPAETISAIRTALSGDGHYVCEGVHRRHFASSSVFCSVEHIALVCASPQSPTASSAGDCDERLFVDDCLTTVLTV